MWRYFVPADVSINMLLLKLNQYMWNYYFFCHHCRHHRLPFFEHSPLHSLEHPDQSYACCQPVMLSWLQSCMVKCQVGWYRPGLCKLTSWWMAPWKTRQSSCNGSAWQMWPNRHSCLVIISGITGRRLVLQFARCTVQFANYGSKPDAGPKHKPNPNTNLT